ncbi:reverse transcriptase domain-containing protein [Tanacetum coccineum]
MSLRTTVLAQQSQIRELQSADRRRQTVITEMLATDHRRQKQLTEALKLIKRLQTQMTEFERQKFEDTSRNTQNQQQQNKRQNTGRAYTARTGKKKPYGGSKPYALNEISPMTGLCAPKYHKCNKVGHFARDCRSMVNANNANNQRGKVATGAWLELLSDYDCEIRYHLGKANAVANPEQKETRTTIRVKP